MCSSPDTMLQVTKCQSFCKIGSMALKQTLLSRFVASTFVMIQAKVLLWTHHTQSSFLSMQIDELAVAFGQRAMPQLVEMLSSPELDDDSSVRCLTLLLTLISNQASCFGSHTCSLTADFYCGKTQVSQVRMYCTQCLHYCHNSRLCHRRPRHRQSLLRLCSVWYPCCLQPIWGRASYPVKCWQVWHSFSKAEWRSCRAMALQLSFQHLTAQLLKEQLAYRYAK